MAIGPLADLYSNQNDMPIYSYPKSLGNSRSGYYISFTILKNQKTNYITSPGAGQLSAPSPVSSALSSISSVSNLNSVSSLASEASAAASVASSIGTSITGAIGTVASVANQALSTATNVAGAAASVVGAVQGVTQIASSAVNATNALGQISGGIAAVSTGVSVVGSVAGAASSAINTVSGVASTVGDILTTNPLDTASKAFDSIKSLFNGSDQATPVDTSSEYDLTFTPSQMQPKGYINLYMPDTVSMAQHASYGDVSVTDALGKYGLAKSLYENSKEFADLTERLASGGIKEAVRTLREGSAPPQALEVGGTAAQGTKVVGSGFTKYILGEAGYAINPQYEVLFTQMDFRTFQFDFTFTPRDADEAADVRNIINLFRFHAAPEIPSKHANRYFVTPSVFNIEYMHLEEKNTNLHKFGACVLTTILVDYAPEVGWVAHDDGMPVKTRMTLQFKETEILSKEKIEQGY